MSAVPSDPTGRPPEHVGDAPPRRRPLLALALLLLLAGAVATGLVVLRGGGSDPAAAGVPNPDLTGVPRPIAEAVESTRGAVARNPQDGGSWGRLGMVLYAHSFSTEALQCLEVAERLAPRDRRWPYLRGMIVSEFDLPTGYEHVLRAHQLLDSDVAIRTRLAEFLFDLRRPDESEHFYRQVLEAELANPRAALGMARISLLRNELPTALDWAQQSVAGAPGLPEPYQLLARIHQAMGERDAARTALATLKTMPDKATAWPDPILAQVNELRRDFGYLNAQAHRLLAEGNTDEGIRVLFQLAEDEPDNPQRFTVLANQLIRIREFSTAARVLDDGLRQHPQAADLQYLRAVVYREQGDPQRAIAQLRSVVAAKPDFAEAHHTLGLCLRETDRTAEAALAFADVLRFEPLYAPAHIELAEVLLEQDRVEDARRHLRTARDIAPTNERVSRLLERIGEDG